MSDASNDGRAKASDSETGVLANLPRTRPQRASPRRAAARRAASAANGTQAKPAAKAPKRASAKASARASTTAATGERARAHPTPVKAKAAKTTRSHTAARREAVPRQGYEADGEIASGSVQPPGASELVSSAAELAGELAKAGVSGGARLLKDLFARLPPG